MHACLGLSCFNTKSCLQHKILCTIKSVASQTRMNQKNFHLKYVKVLTHSLENNFAEARIAGEILNSDVRSPNAYFWIVPLNSKQLGQMH